MLLLHRAAHKLADSIDSLVLSSSEDLCCRIASYYLDNIDRSCLQNFDPKSQVVRFISTDLNRCYIVTSTFALTIIKSEAFQEESFKNSGRTIEFPPPQISSYNGDRSELKRFFISDQQFNTKRRYLERHRT